MTSTINLISRTVNTDALGHEVVTETKREGLMCEVVSISQSEFFAAQNTKLQPEFKFIIFFGDYEGEELLEFEQKRYAIYRTYRAGDRLELYAERKIGA